MAATARQVRRLQRMVDETDSTTYTYGDLADYIERYPLPDERGEDPYTWDTSTTPPTQDANEDWIATYDLNAAAADIWEEKAAAVAEDFQFSADGGSFARNQRYEQYMRMAARYRSRRVIRSRRMVKQPEEDTANVHGWIGNAAETD